MMTFLARTQPTPPSTPHSFPKALYQSLYHPQELAMEKTVSHPLLRLCERGVEPGFHNFKCRALGWLSQGTISGETSCPSKPESGQLVKRMWVNGRNQERVVLSGSPLLLHLLSSTQLSGTIELIKGKGQSHSRILSQRAVKQSLFIFKFPGIYLLFKPSYCSGWFHLW